MLWDRTNGLCFWCGQKTLEIEKADQHHPLNPTLDHVIPRAAGGGKGEENIVLACKACNDVRGQYNISVYQSRERKLLEEINRLKDIIILHVENPTKKVVNPWWKFYGRFGK